jgi:hypothetical protein
MKQAYIISRGMEEFASAREQFALIVDRLQSAAVLGMEHGEVEGLISREGTELMRRLLQGHLDVRAAAETREVGVRGADGVVRSHVREGCRRRLGTIFGEVEVRRCGYSAPEEGSLFPLDGELNLPKDSYSHGLRERLAVEVARGSFDEAVRTIETTTGGQVPKRQAEELAAKMSQDFEAFYEDRASRGPEETLDPLVMSEDGKGIVMRKEDLREGTKRAAERDAHQLKTRLSQGEKRNRKRMATVAAVYSIERQVRTPESIMSVEVQKKEEVPKVRARHKRVWASVERTPEQVDRRSVSGGAAAGPRGEAAVGDVGRWARGADRGYPRRDRTARGRGDAHPRFHPRARIPLEGRLVFLRPRMSGGGSLGRRAGLADPPGQGQRCGRRHAAQCHLTRPLPSGA